MPEVTGGPTRSLAPQPRELIVTLFGLYARDDHHWLSVASLVRMMAAVGVDGPAVRSSISRLKRRGVLDSVRHHSVVGYALASSLIHVIDEGDTRIFGHQRGTIADGFLILAFSVPEAERDKRHALRTILTQLGFGTVSPGVWIAPAHKRAEIDESLRRRGLADYIETFEGNYTSPKALKGKVAQWWDLRSIAASYSTFIDTYGDVADRHREYPMSDEDTFADYVSMLTDWRRLPYLDPGLPLELLPPEWQGLAAEELFETLHEQLRGPAGRFAQSAIDQR
ncbi:PaaX family transcriptional regulator (plasmid) [Rhodococcus erythropolis]|nr:PaaX family transcriptional regulator [Rhodococcus erythropolis]